MVQELLNVKANPYNENDNVSTPCQSKVLVKLRGKQFPVSQFPKRGRYVKYGEEENKSKNIKIRKHQISVKNVQSLFAKNASRFITLRIIFENL